MHNWLPAINIPFSPSLLAAAVIFFQDVLIVATAYFLIKRSFKKRLDAIEWYFQTILNAEKIDMAARIPIPENDILNDVRSIVNGLLARGENAIMRIRGKVDPIVQTIYHRV